MAGGAGASPAGVSRRRTTLRRRVALVSAALVGATSAGLAGAGSTAAQTVADPCASPAPAAHGLSPPPVLGGVLGWGRAEFGRLGPPTTTGYVTSPSTVAGLDPSAGVTAVAAGGNFSLALKADGTVLGWGDDDYGQVGDGTTSLPGTRRIVATPTPVVGLGPGSGVIALAAGYDHGLALKANGSVWAWGHNSDQDLGDGTDADRSAPVPVLDLAPGSGVVAISAGGNGSLALKSDGTVLAWGDRAGRPGGGILGPVGVPGLGAGSGVVAIAAGGMPGGAPRTEHSLARKDDGSVWAWGDNSRGQLGTGAGANDAGNAVPAQVSGLGAGSGVVGIAAGGDHSMVLKSDGSVLAWGNGDRGDLGTAGTAASNVPVGVDGLGAGSGVVSVAAGGNFSLALKADGSLLAWGANDQAQLGTGSPGDLAVPTPVAGLAATAGAVSGAQAVSAGGEHTLAVQSSLFGVCQGAGQTVVVGKRPTFAVALRDQADKPLYFANVTWTVPSSGAGLDPSSGSGRTSTSGVATFSPQANTVAGTYTVDVTATVGSGPSATTQRLSLTITNVADLPTQVTATKGTPQNAAVGRPFATPLSVAVTDQYGNPVPDRPVTFAGPARGAGATFGGGASGTAVTDASGVAAIGATANASMGTYDVVARAGSIPSSATFTLTNINGPVALISAVAGTPQTTTAGDSFATPLQAKLVDASHNPIFDAAVTFTAPTSGASGVFSMGGQTAATVVAYTDGSGVATAPAFVANNTGGTYAVLAQAEGFEPRAVYSLTNAGGVAAASAPAAVTKSSASGGGTQAAGNTGKPAAGADPAAAPSQDPSAGIGLARTGFGALWIVIAGAVLVGGGLLLWRSGLRPGRIRRRLRHVGGADRHPG
ncbi:MAG TPA: hypothetical protein VFJ85_17045 [Acidimicrobiales bacterium]|nr:hypothetical protein [Acidimicrobiales bacterium]